MGRANACGGARRAVFVIFMHTSPPAPPAATPDRIPVRRVLVSVFDKTGLDRLGRGLAAAGVEVVSTGGTARALAA